MKEHIGTLRHNETPSAVTNFTNSSFKPSLQRDGRLQRRDGKWTLTVSRKTVDVLVDQIPWGFAVILHPWMSKELAVIW